MNTKGRAPKQKGTDGKRGYVATMLYNLLNPCFIGWAPGLLAGLSNLVLPQRENNRFTSSGTLTPGSVATTIGHGIIYDSKQRK